MAWGGEAGRSNVAKDFFISYSPADEPWATWMAWELEQAGFTTMLQAWDFVPGTNFIDFMDRGVSKSVAVIAILSRNYINSTYGRLEWQAAIRRSPNDPGSRLITVRIEEFPLEGLLATITYVDLVPVDNPETARMMLLRRVRQAMDGRAKPTAAPAYPRPPDASAGFVPPAPPRARIRMPQPAAPTTRPADQPAQLLQIIGPQFGLDASEPLALQAKRILTELEIELDQVAGDPKADMLLLAGDLTAHGNLREYDVALEFVAGLRDMLELGARHIAVVPGNGDVNAAACRAYFATCEADEVTPEPPYWPKWRHYASFLQRLYAEAGNPPFRPGQPWDLVVVPELRIAVATINSTMAVTHRDQDGPGWVGAEQARWFAHALDTETGPGWLRVGLLNHDPREDHELRDASQVRDVIGPRTDVFVAGRGAGQRPGRLGRLITLRPSPTGVTVETRDL